MTVKISGKNTWIVLLCFPIKLLGKLYCEITDIWKTLIQNLFTEMLHLSNDSLIFTT